MNSVVSSRKLTGFVSFGVRFFNCSLAKKNVQKSNKSTNEKGKETHGKRSLYFDLQSTTPVDPRVLDKIMYFFTNKYGNPHSSTHSYGWEAEKEIEIARKKIGDVINADSKEIIFTSGSTESNNLVIKGVPSFYKKNKNHIITCQTEHKCILNSCRYMQNKGYQVTYLPVDDNGSINLDQLYNSITENTVLVSLMAVNNEIGVIHPLEKIGQICKEKKVFFHSDASQGFGKIPIDVNKMNIDLLSISSHKIYGPKGIGACFVRRRPRVRLEPLISGGGQERGLRSGTLPTPLIAGFGEAAKILNDEMEFDYKHILRLSEKIKKNLLTIKDVKINESKNKEFQYPGCINASFPYVEGESLLMSLNDIALSSGSACTSTTLEPSYVLKAMGLDDFFSHSSIRFGIGKFTTDSEIDFVNNTIKKKVEFLRNLSPLWEMVQEGIDLKLIQWNSH